MDDERDRNREADASRARFLLCYLDEIDPFFQALATSLDARGFFQVPPV